MKAKFLIPLLLLIAACTTNKPMTDEQKAAVQEEATAAVKVFFNAMAASDLEAMTGIMENSTDFNYIVGGDVYNYDNMVDMAGQYIPLVESQTFDTKFEKYVIVSTECFIYTWHGKNGMIMNTGEDYMMEDYLCTWCFRKDEDGWKIFVGHESEKTPIPIDTTAVE